MPKQEVKATYPNRKGGGTETLNMNQQDKPAVNDKQHQSSEPKP